jgi:hypothetical protein
MDATTWLFLVDFSLVFYVLGATFVEGFVNYRTWSLIGDAEFRSFHRAVGPRIQAVLVAPLGAALVLTLLLVWWRPAPIPGWSVGLSLGLNLVAVVVSLFSQVPIQLKLDRTGRSPVLLRRLIRTEWLRSVPHSLNAVLFIWMMSTLIGRGFTS